MAMHVMSTTSSLKRRARWLATAAPTALTAVMLLSLVAWQFHEQARIGPDTPDGVIASPASRNDRLMGDGTRVPALLVLVDSVEEASTARRLLDPAGNDAGLTAMQPATIAVLATAGLDPAVIAALADMVPDQQVVDLRAR